MVPAERVNEGAKSHGSLRQEGLVLWHKQNLSLEGQLCEKLHDAGDIERLKQILNSGGLFKLIQFSQYQSWLGSAEGNLIEPGNLNLRLRMAGISRPVDKS